MPVLHRTNEHFNTRDVYVGCVDTVNAAFSRWNSLINMLTKRSSPHRASVGPHPLMPFFHSFALATFESLFCRPTTVYQYLSNLWRAFTKIIKIDRKLLCISLFKKFTSQKTLLKVSRYSSLLKNGMVFVQRFQRKIFKYVKIIRYVSTAAMLIIFKRHFSIIKCC